jgi:cytidylate kinase
MHRVVTIDGPAGAGKSTVARRLATRLGWSFLDTGAMYRAITLAAIRSGIDMTSDEELGKLVDTLEYAVNGEAIRLDGEDVTEAIRKVEVTKASKYAADSPSVRNRLLEWQRDFARGRDVVTEGRDQGTVVFPGAFRKFYLTATPEERARRRSADYQERGVSVRFEVVLEDQRLRDARDAAREIAPMRPAEDALILDTTGSSLDSVIDRIVADIEHRLVGSLSEGATCGGIARG